MLALLIQPAHINANNAVTKPYNIESLVIDAITNAPIPSIDRNANSW